MKTRLYYSLAGLFLLISAAGYTAEKGSERTQVSTLDVLKVGDKLVAVQNGMPVPAFEKQDRDYIDLGGKWKKLRFEGADHRLSLKTRTPSNISLLEKESGGAQSPGFNDGAWEQHVVPGVENPVPDRYEGCAWYRNKFDIPASAKGKFAKLVFEGANYVTDVWVNGKWAGTHEGGYTPFAFDISGALNYGGDNVIAVRVDNIPWIPLGQQEKTSKYNDRNIVPFSLCDWWNYGGITRDVYIEIAPEVCIARADVKARIGADKSCTLDIQAVVYNPEGKKWPATLEYKIYPAQVTEKNMLAMNAREIADLSKPAKIVEPSEIRVDVEKDKILTFSRVLTLPSPALWSSENPNLYVLELTLKNRDNSETQKFYTQFGVREIKVDIKNCKVLINNEPVFLRGIARTEVFPGEKEMDLPPAQFLLRDLKLLKDVNADFLRAGHWPNNTLTYLLTDRLGFTVWEEIPVYWLDGPAFDIQRKDRKIALQMWLEMIYKDYNRPSVMFLGTANECSWQSERALYIQSLRQVAYQVDGTRLIAQSASGSDPGDKTQAACDVLGATMYYGVFYGKNVYDDTMDALEKMHGNYPAKPIIATEYGYWSENDLASADLQAEIVKDSMRAFKGHEAVAGAICWTSFDYHTMITDPQTMGLMRGDRLFTKPAYFDAQRIYADFAGQWPLKIISPQAERAAGDLALSIGITQDMPAKRMAYSMDFGQYNDLKKESPGVYSASLNTRKLSEGRHSLRVRGVGPAGQVMLKQIELFVDNVDNAPTVELLAPRDKDMVMGSVKIRVMVGDDRGVASVSALVDGTPAEVKSEGDGVYAAKFDARRFTNGKQIALKIKAADSGGNITQKTISVTVDNSPGLYITLPYNQDWISSGVEAGDGTGYDFPADILPDSGSEFVFNGKDDKVKFKFGKKEPLERNCVECDGGVVDVRPGNYTKVYLLGSLHNAAKKVPFKLLYTDGSSEIAFAPLSDWWRGIPSLGEEVGFFSPMHMEKEGLKKPAAGMYVQWMPADPKRTLKGIVLPNDDKVRVFAMTAIGKETSVLPPTVDIKYPKKGDTITGIFTPVAEINGKDLAKIEYTVDGQKVSKEEIDTRKFKDGEHVFGVSALDKTKQITKKIVNITVSNNHLVVSPALNENIGRKTRIRVTPRYQSKIDNIAYAVDGGEYAPLEKKDGAYETLWEVPKEMLPGSRHEIAVRITEAGPRVTEQKIPVSLVVPLRGHKIKVDKNTTDWIGVPPKKDNTWVLSNNEFIWKDSLGDDKGPGTYTYPASPSFKDAADIKEVRITFDDRCLYIYIRGAKPGDWWAPYRLIGIHKEGSQEAASEILAQGSYEQVSADAGCYGNIRVSPELACQYVVGVSGTYKGRIWNGKGELVAKKVSDSNDTPEFKIDDENWETIEMAVPYTVVGNPAGQTWKFIIGMGVQDNDYLRSVVENASEWNGGGGAGEANGALSLTPKLYDITGSDVKTQQKELGSFDPAGKAGDPKAFAVLNESCLSVTFEE
jgi:beta-galactosidase/beta-glucuronidase